MKGFNEKELIEAAIKLQRACQDDYICESCPFDDGGECEKTWGGKPPYKWELPSVKRKGGGEDARRGKRRGRQAKKRD